MGELYFIRVAAENTAGLSAWNTVSQSFAMEAENLAAVQYWNGQGSRNQSYQAGEISYSDLSLYLSQAIEIRKNYLDNLNAYNQAIIEYNYFTNK